MSLFLSLRVSLLLFSPTCFCLLLDGVEKGSLTFMVCLVWGVTKSPAPSDVDLAGLRTDELELSGTMTEVLEPASTMAEVRDPAGTMKEEDVLAGTMTEELELATAMTEVHETAGTITEEVVLAGTMTEGLELAGTVTTELGGEVDWVEATEGMVET